MIAWLPLMAEYVEHRRACAHCTLADFAPEVFDSCRCSDGLALQQRYRAALLVEREAMRGRLVARRKRTALAVLWFAALLAALSPLVLAVLA